MFDGVGVTQTRMLRNMNELVLFVCTLCKCVAERLAVVSG